MTHNREVATCRHRNEKTRPSPSDRWTVRSTAEAARQSLAAYGEPTISLEELRRRMAEGVKIESLGDWIVTERESSW